MRTPLVNEVELQARDQGFLFRQHAYELTQKLAYYVISVELVFCGYMLLNAERLSQIQGASYLFVVCGIAAFFGILWRFFYNQTYHNHAHEVQGVMHLVANYSQIVSYSIYIVLSVVTFVWALIAGFVYLDTRSDSTIPPVSIQRNLADKSPASLSSASGLKQIDVLPVPQISPSSRIQENVKSVAPSQQNNAIK